VLLLQPKGLQGTTLMLPLAEAFQQSGANLVTLEMDSVAEQCQDSVSLIGGSYELFLALAGQQLKQAPADFAIAYAGNQFMEETQSHTIRNFLADLGIPQISFFTRPVTSCVSFYSYPDSLQAANWSRTHFIATSPDFAPPLEHTPRLVFRYLPPGCNKRLFSPVESAEKKADILFAGAFTPWRALVLDALSSGMSLRIHGDHRFKLLAGANKYYAGPIDYFTGLNGSYAQARAVLDIAPEPGMRRVSARVFDAALGGNAVLAPESDLINACLAPHAEYAPFADTPVPAEQLAALFTTVGASMKTGHLFSADSLAAQFPQLAEAVRHQASEISAAFCNARLHEAAAACALGKRARERVLAEHLWEHRLPRLLEIAQAPSAFHCAQAV
jgi:hypothetical protein